MAKEECDSEMKKCAGAIESASGRSIACPGVCGYWSQVLGDHEADVM